jgi:EmrB/QacA subfamily drug resistance transporter
MVVLDITIVNVALPSIGRSLHFARSDLQWVVTAYVLCSGGLVLLGGRAADLFGRRRMFIAGVTVFTAASLVSALALSAAVLIAARVAQGTGAAMLTPAALSIITTVYAGAQRATALSVWGAIASGGIAAGVLLGGMLTTWLNWHWVFLVNVPVGAAAALLAPRVVPALPATGRRRSLDLPGAVTLVGGLGVLVYAISGAASHGWGSTRTIVLLVVAIVLLAGFALVERSMKEPLVPPAFWRSRSMVSGAAAMLGALAILGGTFFLVSLFMQNTLHYSPLHAGLAFLPFVAATGAGVHITSRLIGRAGSRVLIAAGMAVTVAGALVLRQAPDHTAFVAAVLPGLVLLGAGMGLAIPAISITTMSQVRHATAGLASGVLSTAHEIGAALGTAVLSAIAATGSYGSAFLTGAVIAAVLAVAALAVVPVVRPAPGERVAVH